MSIPAAPAPAADNVDAIATAVAAIQPERMEEYVRRLVGFGTRSTISTRTDPERGIGAAARWLRAKFEEISRETGGRLTVQEQSFVHPAAERLPQPTEITNIVATLPGTLPDRRRRSVVVSAHYDSRAADMLDPDSDAPGANDDASGIAAVLELARVLSPYCFPATIIFLCVAGEEQGLLGAEHFAEQAKEAGLRIDTLLNNDTIGNSTGGNGIHDGRSVRVFSEGVPQNMSVQEMARIQAASAENDSPSRQLARLIRETGKRYVPEMDARLIARRDRYLRGGDHMPFLARGFAAVRLTEANENYNRQHQDVRVVNGVREGDLPEHMDFAYAANVARINAAALATLALAPAAPKDVKIITRGVGHDTVLEWTRSEDEDLVAGYEVVWRETTAFEWTYALYVGPQTRKTLSGVSKDDFHFGVRAVGKDGFRSLVTFAYPDR